MKHSLLNPLGYALPLTLAIWLGWPSPARSHGALWIAHTGQDTASGTHDTLYPTTPTTWAGSTYTATATPDTTDPTTHIVTINGPGGASLASTHWRGGSIGTLPSSDGGGVRVLTLADREHEMLEQESRRVTYVAIVIGIAFACFWTFRDSFWRRSTQL